MTATLRIGTRGSSLALAQTQTVADSLAAQGADVEITVVSTAGDRSSAPIEQIGVGVFTSALRRALAAGDVDIAVHSYKDLPTADEPGLVLAAVPKRADPRDVLVARDGLTLDALPPGAVIATGSPRRAAQLRALRRGFEIVGLRGNVDSRIATVTSGKHDAVILAAAGLQRLGRLGEATEIIDPARMLPAPAQGALAVECRADDVDVEHLVRSTLDDGPTAAAVAAERALLAALEAGCSAPVGALAKVVTDRAGAADLVEPGSVVYPLSLHGVAAAGSDELIRASAVADHTQAQRLGRQVAAELLERGAAALAGPGNKQ